MRGVAQRLARMVWDHEVGGSNPLTPTMTITSCALGVTAIFACHEFADCEDDIAAPVVKQITVLLSSQ